eukprot:TRINITY_DN1524_c2_g1_i1.p1 TRINITY_DN1524_c2_g1~~TRINITY_DN1524_c2_g1_i1.p1  ORF type:complete len:477 (+),score=113.09 TRINITY_DN1524_c2_g1_i1:27-1433(+)
MAEDQAKVYRQVLAGIVRELHSRALPLLVPCPNGPNEVGDGRDLWLLNPRAGTGECMQGFEFLGQLLGLAVRSGEALPLRLAPFVWKGLLGDRRLHADIRGIDHLSARLIERITMMAADESADVTAMGLHFACPGLSGEEEVELVPGGRSREVRTLNDALEFAALLRQQRLTCDDMQVRAMRRGLAVVVPARLLHLWTWRDLRCRVGAEAEVDLELLQRHTRYRNCPAGEEEPAVLHLWAALHTFTQDQRQTFLRFIWARRSLPFSEPWKQDFTVELMPPLSAEASSPSHLSMPIIGGADDFSGVAGGADAGGGTADASGGSIASAAAQAVSPGGGGGGIGDLLPRGASDSQNRIGTVGVAGTATSGADDGRLPFAQTCAFVLLLPRYSSADVCRSRLLFAMAESLRDDEGDDDEDSHDEEDRQIEGVLAAAARRRWLEEKRQRDAARRERIAAAAPNSSEADLQHIE